MAQAPVTTTSLVKSKADLISIIQFCSVEYDLIFLIIKIVPIVHLQHQSGYRSCP